MAQCQDAYCLCALTEGQPQQHPQLCEMPTKMLMLFSTSGVPSLAFKLSLALPSYQLVCVICLPVQQWLSVRQGSLGAVCEPCIFKEVFEAWVGV